MKILLAVDGSPCSDVAVEEIGQTALAEGFISESLECV